MIRYTSEIEGKEAVGVVCVLMESQDNFSHFLWWQIEDLGFEGCSLTTKTSAPDLQIQFGFSNLSLVTCIFKDNYMH